MQRPIYAIELESLQMQHSRLDFAVAMLVLHQLLACSPGIKCTFCSLDVACSCEIDLSLSVSKNQESVQIGQHVTHIKAC